MDITAENAIRTLVQHLQDAWNKKDSALWSSAFAPTHDYIAFNGFQMLDQSREANAAMHTQVWNTLYKDGSTIALDILKIRFLAPDIAVVHLASVNDYMADGSAQKLNGSISLVVKNTEGEGWLIDTFHAGTKQESFQGHVKK